MQGICAGLAPTAEVCAVLHWFVGEILATVLAPIQGIKIFAEYEAFVFRNCDRRRVVLATDRDCDGLIGDGALVVCDAHHEGLADALISGQGLGCGLAVVEGVGPDAAAGTNRDAAVGAIWCGYRPGGGGACIGICAGEGARGGVEIGVVFLNGSRGLASGETDAGAIVGAGDGDCDGVGAAQGRAVVIGCGYGIVQDKSLIIAQVVKSFGARVEGPVQGAALFCGAECRVGGQGEHP